MNYESKPETTDTDSGSGMEDEFQFDVTELVEGDYSYRVDFEVEIASLYPNNSL